jgi:hypothetical protein
METPMPARHDVIRAALTRYAAGERLRILSFLNDALDRENLRDMDCDEEDEVMACWATDLLPFSENHIPRPAVADQVPDEDEDYTLARY